MLSFQYGWTSEYIWTMTLREIDWRLRSIVDRTNQDNKFRALLHDKEIKTEKVSKEAVKENKLTQAQEAAMNSAFIAAKSRKSNGK